MVFTDKKNFQNFLVHSIHNHHNNKVPEKLKAAFSVSVMVWVRIMVTAKTLPPLSSCSLQSS